MTEGSSDERSTPRSRLPDPSRLSRSHPSYPACPIWDSGHLMSFGAKSQGCVPRRHLLRPRLWTPWPLRGLARPSTSTAKERARHCFANASPATSKSGHPLSSSYWGRLPVIGALACRGSRSPRSASSPAKAPRRRRRRSSTACSPSSGSSATCSLERRPDAPGDRLHEPAADERRGRGRAPVRPRPREWAQRRRCRAHRRRRPRRTVGAAPVSRRRPGLQSGAG